MSQYGRLCYNQEGRRVLCDTVGVSRNSVGITSSGALQKFLGGRTIGNGLSVRRVFPVFLRSIS
jgi:hypothetical protein